MNINLLVKVLNLLISLLTLVIRMLEKKAEKEVARQNAPNIDPKVQETLDRLSDEQLVQAIACRSDRLKDEVDFLDYV
jgi:hypothetical protein